MPIATGNAPGQQMHTGAAPAHTDVNVADLGQNTRETSAVKMAAENPAPNNNPNNQGIWQLLIPLAIIFGIMWLMLIRPQKKREQQRQEMLNQLKKGDKVVTIGGIIGEISRINDREVELRTEGGGKISFTRNAISRILNQDTGE